VARERTVPAGYLHGPAAATDGLRVALARVPDPVAMVLVEGVSDQIAVEAVAGRLGDDLVASRVAVVPVGGAGGVRRALVEHTSPTMRVAVLCDLGEEAQVRRGIAASGVDSVVAVCDADLEDELIRAVGIDGALAVVAAEGDARSFATLQHQSAWRGRPVAAQLRRYLGAGARRKLRYAHLLAHASVDVDRIPAPLVAVLTAVR
jgi:hypothetical protein